MYRYMYISLYYVPKTSVLLMLASHCPDFCSIWAHDEGNLQHRTWSWIHRVIRDCILSHRVSIGWVFKVRIRQQLRECSQNLWHVKKVPMVFPKLHLRVDFVCPSRPMCGHRETIVCTSCWFVWPSSLLRMAIGDTRHFLHTMAIRWTHGACWWSREGYTTSRGLRIAIAWHFVTF